MEYDELVSDIDLWSISQTQANQGALLATSSTDANGNTTKSYTDAAGRTLAAEDAEGEKKIAWHAMRLTDLAAATAVACPRLRRKPQGRQPGSVCCGMFGIDS
jgi:YD repeat-containing protein